MATSSAPNSSPTSYNSPAQAMSARLAQNWWAVAIRGVFAIIFGLIAFFWTGVTILSLIWFFAAYMLVDGVCGIVAAVRAARRNERWGLLLLEGIADIAAGIIAWVWPGITLFVLILMMAAWSLVTGVLMIVAAFKLHPTYGRGWLIFSGIVSVLFGIALVVSPPTAAIVLTWWLGAYALVFGVALLVLAFKLRSHKDDVVTTAPPMPRGA